MNILLCMLIALQPNTMTSIITNWTNQNNNNNNNKLENIDSSIYEVGSAKLYDLANKGNQATYYINKISYLVKHHIA